MDAADYLMYIMGGKLFKFGLNDWTVSCQHVPEHGVLGSRTINGYYRYGPAARTAAGDLQSTSVEV